MLFRSLLPSFVSIAEMAPADADPESLPSRERDLIARAVAQRRREFAAGRTLARRLLRDAGVDIDALLVDPDRVPTWPQAVAGSITHCSSLCAVAVVSAAHADGIGLDVEPAVPLPEHLLPQIVSDDERIRIDALPSALRPLGGLLVFSIKEAVYKAVYPRCRVYLDFHQVEVAFDGDDGFTAEVLVPDATLPGHARIQGRFRIADGHVASAVVLARR
jgi:4'-phosphopantetheinyl transferase EntD